MLLTCNLSDCAGIVKLEGLYYLFSWSPPLIVYCNILFFYLQFCLFFPVKYPSVTFGFIVSRFLAFPHDILLKVCSIKWNKHRKKQIKQWVSSSTVERHGTSMVRGLNSITRMLLIWLALALLERGITDHLIATFSVTVSITSNMNNVIHILLRICPDVSFFWHHSPFRILCYRQIFYWTLLMILILGFL